MKVCVIGGGNIGTLLTAEFSFRGYETYIYTHNISQWNDVLKAMDDKGNELFVSYDFTVTNDLELAVNNADFVWLTYPAFMFNTIADQLLSLMRKGQTLVCVPGSGGAEFAFSSIVKKGVILCGLQRVHCITRIKEKGKSVLALGRKTSVNIATIPAAEANNLCITVSEMLDMPCKPLPNYLCITLTPSNPILHTSRLYSMFINYHEGVYYDHNILFYEEWSDNSSKILLACDDELQKLCHNLKNFDLSDVVSLKEHYESQTIDAMTKKISSIVAFKGITSPMKKTKNGWIPDFESRYFKADFSYGLKVLIDIADSAGVLVPTMKEIWDWYLNVNPKSHDKYFSLNNCQIYKSYYIEGI